MRKRVEWRPWAPCRYPARRRGWLIVTAVTWAFVLLWADGITAAFHAFSQGTAAVEESVFVTLHTVAFVILVTGLTTTLLVFGFSERRSLPLIAALPLAVILLQTGARVRDAASSHALAG